MRKIFVKRALYVALLISVASSIFCLATPFEVVISVFWRPSGQIGCPPPKWGAIHVTRKATKPRVQKTKHACKMNHMQEGIHNKVKRSRTAPNKCLTYTYTTYMLTNVQLARAREVGGSPASCWNKTHWNGFNSRFLKVTIGTVSSARSENQISLILRPKELCGYLG